MNPDFKAKLKQKSIDLVGGPKSTLVAVRMPLAMKDKLKKISKESHTSLSSVILEALNFALSGKK